MLNIDAERWRQIQPILDRALELSPSERSSWLDTACADAPALRAAVEHLLQADAETGVLDSSPQTFLQMAIDERERSDAADIRFLPGALLAERYRIVNLLGRGGMGEVYRADDLKLGQPVALKFLPARVRERPDLLERLLKEARIARQVSHPNVCRVYDVGEAQGRTFITMEYIDGEDLRSLLDRIGQLSARKALDIARQLCSGLQVAHELGVLHRDLKPANVMLDARGRIRVTDFGLAVAAHDHGTSDTRSGTPAYMAPEQLDGRDATVQSDVFAMGLVLYELFTGARAFPPAGIDELRRIYEETRPVKPTALTPGLDPAIERTILACLENDATLRPRGARAVAAALPGGDPIAAAIEAGETPPPELVAASGPDGSLDPAWAFGTLAATLVMVVVLMVVSDRASVLGWVQWPRSSAALEDNARELLQRLGHDLPAGDRTSGIDGFGDAYRRYVRATDQSSDRWEALKQPGQWGVVFWYRQAPTVMTPWNPDARVGWEDPPPVPGDARVVTDLRGRLIALQVAPELADPPADRSVTPDWRALFKEAGLDFEAFHSVDPTRNPTVTADSRAAWAGAASEWGNVPVRVEAAAHRGRPVYFEQVLPWDPYWDPASATPAVPPFSRLNTAMFRMISLMTLIAMPAIAIALVARNWFTGRGDRQGALRLAAIVFCIRFSIWAVGGHHVPALREEWILFSIALGKSLADAAATWVLYLALESYARRLHPRFLVSWNRLLVGRRYRDPLVGRDILAGVALSMIVTLFWLQLPIVIPHALGHDAPPPPMFFPLGGLPSLYFLNSPTPQAILGGRYVLEALADSVLGGFGVAVTYLIILLGLHLILRRLWAALLVYSVLVLIVSPTTEGSGYSAISMVCSLIYLGAAVWGFRFGLVGFLAMWFSLMTLGNFPVTANVAAPHFGIGLVGVAAVAALATFGAVTATRRVKVGALMS